MTSSALMEVDIEPLPYLISNNPHHQLSTPTVCLNPSTPYHPDLIQAMLQSAVGNKTPSTNNTLVLVPWTDVTLQYLKCEAFCERLRVCHNFEQLISKPITSTDLHTNPQNFQMHFHDTMLQWKPCSTNSMQQCKTFPL